MSSVPKFFEGLEINYAENVLRHGMDGGPDAERVALVDVREGQELGLESSNVSRSRTGATTTVTGRGGQVQRIQHTHMAPIEGGSEDRQQLVKNRRHRKRETW